METLLNFLKPFGELGIYSGLFYSENIDFIKLNIDNLSCLLSPIFFSNENKKSLCRRAWIGIKEAKELELLPPHILRINNLIYVKLFRVIGGFSSFLIVSGISDKIVNRYIFYLLCFTSIIFGIYKIIISIYAMINYVKLFREGKLFVKNRPIDSFGSFFKLAFTAAKFTGRVTYGTGASFVLASALDKALEEKGKKPIFVPAIHDLFQRSGILNPVINQLEEWGVLVPNSPEVKVDFNKASKFIDSKDKDLNFKKHFNSNSSIQWNDLRDSFKNSVKMKAPKSVAEWFDPKDPFKRTKNK